MRLRAEKLQEENLVQKQELAHVHGQKITLSIDTVHLPIVWPMLD